MRAARSQSTMPETQSMAEAGSIPPLKVDKGGCPFCVPDMTSKTNDCQKIEIIPASPSRAAKRYSDSSSPVQKAQPATVG